MIIRTSFTSIVSKISKNRFLLISFVILYWFVSLLSLNSDHNWGDDFAQYIAQAKNISEGKPYGQTGYIYTSLNPTYAPPSYPPLTSLMLVPAFKYYGVDIVAFKQTMLFVFLLSIIVIYKFFLNLEKPVFVWVLLFIFAVNPWVWQFKYDILSDIPFTLFVYLSFLLTIKLEKSLSKLNNLFAAILLGTAIYLAFITRTVGIVLLPAITAYMLCRPKRNIMGLAVSIGIFLILICIQGVAIGNINLYGDAISSGNSIFYNIFWNSLYYANGLRSIFPAPFGISYITSSFIIFAIIAGLLLHINQKKEKKLILLSYLRKAEIYDWFTAIYLVGILTMPFSQSPRYLLPVLPIFIYYILKFFSILFKKKVGNERLVQGHIFLITAVYYAIIYIISSTNPGINKPENRDLITYVKDKLPEDARVVFDKPRALALFTAKKCTPWPLVDETSVWNYLYKEKISYLVFSKPNSKLYNGISNPDKINDNYHVSLRKMHENADFIIYKILFDRT